MPGNAHQHTDSTGSVECIPVGSRTDSRPGCSGSHVGTCGSRHIRQHLQKQPKDGLYGPLFNAFQTQPLRGQTNKAWHAEKLALPATESLVSGGAKNS